MVCPICFEYTGTYTIRRAPMQRKEAYLFLLVVEETYSLGMICGELQEAIQGSRGKDCSREEV